MPRTFIMFDEWANGRPTMRALNKVLGGRMKSCMKNKCMKKRGGNDDEKQEFIRKLKEEMFEWFDSLRKPQSIAENREASESLRRLAEATGIRLMEVHGMTPEEIGNIYTKLPNFRIFQLRDNEFSLRQSLEYEVRQRAQRERDRLYRLQNNGFSSI